MSSTKRVSAADTDGTIRNVATYLVLGVGMLGITLLSALVILVKRGDAPSVQLVFSSVLPLLASWVGTVLAYHFSQRNLAAATKSVTDLARGMSGEERPAVLARDKMIDRSRMIVIPEDPQAALSSLDARPLKDLRAYMDLRHVRRIAVLDGERVKLVLHDELLLRFLHDWSERAGAAATPATFKDLLDAAEFRKRGEGCFAVVAAQATLAAARAKMDEIPHGKDVFVTESGRPEDRVLGWLTDREIAQSARL